MLFLAISYRSRSKRSQTSRVIDTEKYSFETHSECLKVLISHFKTGRFLDPQPWQDRCSNFANGGFFTVLKRRELDARLCGREWILHFVKPAGSRKYRSLNPPSRPECS